MDPHRSHPGLKDIAKVAGVSIMTVSNVLRPKKDTGRALFSEETEKRVLAVARKLDYVPNRAARAMRSKHTGVVGFVASHFSVVEGEKRTDPGAHLNPFLRGIVQTLSPLGRHIALVELNELELIKSRKLPVALRERFFDALIIHYGLSQKAIKLLTEFGIPLIHLDSGLAEPGNCIYRNEFEVGRQVTAHLIELGHRKIAFAVGVGGWEAYKKGFHIHYSFSNRYEGYLQAMKESGLRPSVLEGYDIERLGSQLQRDTLTAAVTMGGHTALMRAVALLGKRIPDDFSVLACDVDAQTPDRGDKFGGAVYDRCNAGRIAAELLSKRIDNDGIPVPSVELPFEIVDGATAGPCRTRVKEKTL